MSGWNCGKHINLVFAQPGPVPVREKGREFADAINSNITYAGDNLIQTEGTMWRSPATLVA